MKLIKITKSGYVFIFITIFLGFASINTANNLLYLITSCLLGFMGISGFFGKRNIENFEFSIKTPEEIYTNRDFSLNLKIKNRKKFFPSFLINIKIQDKILKIPFIDKFFEIEESIIFKFQKRGWHKINKIYIFSPFPYNFFVRSKKYPVNLKVLVFPEPLKFSIKNLYIEQSSKGEKFIDEKGFTGDIIKIREYSDSDPMRLIHWKISSKYENLFVKELSSEGGKPIIIDFEKFQIKDVEKKLSYLTYLVLHHENFILKVNGKYLKDKREILTFLAHY